MGACVVAVGGGFGLKRQYKQVEAVQTHRYPLVHVPCGWIRPGARVYAGILAATAHIGVYEGVIFAIFSSTVADISDRVVRSWQSEKYLMAKNTWYGPH